MKFSTTGMLPLAALITVSAAVFDPDNTVVDPAIIKNLKYVGCYATISISLMHTYAVNTHNSAGLCAQMCWNSYKSPVVAMESAACFCGTDLPPAKALVEDKFCHTACSEAVGIDDIHCGAWESEYGKRYYSVVSTGVKEDLEEGVAYDENNWASGYFSTLVPKPTTTPTPTPTKAAESIGAAAAESTTASVASSAEPANSPVRTSFASFASPQHMRAGVVGILSLTLALVLI